MEAVALSIRQTNGTVVSRSTLLGFMTEVTPDENKVYKYTGNGGATLFEGVHYDGASTFEGYRRKAFVANQNYKLGDIDKFYPAASITKVTTDVAGTALATTLPAAGGTVVYVHGDNFSGATSVTFGGTVGTAFSIQTNQRIQVTTPAKAAGAYAVVVVDDGATNPSLANGATFV